MSCSRTYPYPSHRRVFGFNSPSLWNSSKPPCFPFKILAFQNSTGHLPQGGYQYFLELLTARLVGTSDSLEMRKVHISD